MKTKKGDCGRKRAEEALKQAQSRIESVLNGRADLHSLSTEMAVSLRNEARCVRSTAPREQIIGRSYGGLSRHRGHRIGTPIRRAMEERVHVASNSIIQNRIPGGRTLLPRAQGLSVFATDITERKQAEDVCAEAKIAFAWSMRHNSTMAWSFGPTPSLISSISVGWTIRPFFRRGN